MHEPLTFKILAFLVPMGGSVIAYRLARHRSLYLAGSLLIPVLVGEVVAVWAYAKFGSLAFWRAVIYAYPFALVPLGFWSPFAGLLAWLILERTVLGKRISLVTSVSLGIVIGATVGALLLAGYFVVVGAILQGGADEPGPWAVVGAAAGAVGGVILALFLAHQSRLIQGGQDQPIRQT